MKLNTSKTKTMIVAWSRTIHPQSPALTIGGTVLKESDDLVVLGVTFDSKMTFEKHLRSISRAASQQLVIFRKSSQVFFVLPVLEYCSAVWCSAADTHLKLTTGPCSPRGALIAHRYTYASPRCRTSQYRMIFISLTVSLWNDLGDPVFYCVGLADPFQEQGQCLFICLAACSLVVSYCFPFIFFHAIGWYCGAGAFGLIRCYSLSPYLALPTFFNNNNLVIVLQYLQ